MPINPVRRFLKLVRALEQSDVPLIGRFPLDRPLGQEKEPGGIWHYTDVFGDVQRSVWRLHPGTYCTRGQPYYDEVRLEELYEESETSKVLYEHDGLQFTWGWGGFTRPTNIYWGIRPTDFYYGIRDNSIGEEECFYTKQAMLDAWTIRQGRTPRKSTKRKRDLLMVPAGYEGSFGSPWDERLYLQIVNESRLYPQLQDIYRSLATRVIAEGKTEDDFWEEFFPVVEGYWYQCFRAYAAYYECFHVKEHIPILERRQAAWHIARRFRIECEINPQDFGVKLPWMGEEP